VVFSSIFIVADPNLAEQLSKAALQVLVGILVDFKVLFAFRRHRFYLGKKHIKIKKSIPME
jgi:hypothetical protein